MNKRTPTSRSVRLDLVPEGLLGTDCLIPSLTKESCLATTYWVHSPFPSSIQH